jgi:hypothetical protein
MVPRIHLETVNRKFSTETVGYSRIIYMAQNIELPEGTPMVAVRQAETLQLFS